MWELTDTEGIIPIINFMSPSPEKATMTPRLSDAELDQIAEKAAEKVISKMPEAHLNQIAEKAAEKAVAKMTNMVYTEVGKGVLNKMLWFVGVLAVALYAYAQGKGWVK